MSTDEVNSELERLSWRVIKTKIAGQYVELTFQRFREYHHPEHEMGPFTGHSTKVVKLEFMRRLDETGRLISTQHLPSE